MEININGKAADITIESEKTAGEVLSGVQQWLESGGHFVSGLEINGKIYGSASMDEAFNLPLSGISSMNIKTSSWAELMLEALLSLKSDLEFYEKLKLEEKQNCHNRWKNSVPALFLKDHCPDLHQAALKTLEEFPLESSLSIAGLISMVKERIREIENPALEMTAVMPLTEEIAKRLEDLPLDMQTGKDARAAETITLFSSIIEKIFRLIFLFKQFGTIIEDIELFCVDSTEKQRLNNALEEFSAALKELIAAYENKDTVLVGDLAEYELAPRLRLISKTLCGIKPKE